MKNLVALAPVLGAILRPVQDDLSALLDEPSTSADRVMSDQPAFESGKAQK